MLKKIVVNSNRVAIPITVDQFVDLEQWMEARSQRELVTVLNWAAENWGRRETLRRLRKEDPDQVKNAHIHIPPSLPVTEADKVFQAISDLDRENKAQLAAMMRDRGLARELKEARDGAPTNQGV